METSGNTSPEKPTSAQRPKSTSTKSSATKSAFHPTTVPSHSPELMNLGEYKIDQYIKSGENESKANMDVFKSTSANANFSSDSTENDYLVNPDDLIRAYCSDLGVSVNDLDELADSKLISNALNKPFNNGFYASKVNPSFHPDFSYLSRNLLVNRRLALKKQKENSYGLVPICPPIVPYNHPPGQTPHNPNLNRPKSMQNGEKKANEEANNNQTGAKTDQSSSKYLFRSPIISLVMSRHSFKDRDNNSGPTPMSYNIPDRPPNEKNAPEFTMRQRCLVEKNGGARTSWAKEWFSSNQPFIKKTDFKREGVWPAPTNYKLKPTIGDQTQINYHKAPMHSIAAKLNTDKPDGKDLIDPKLVGSDQDLADAGAEYMVEIEKLHTKTISSSGAQIKMSMRKYPDIIDCVKFVQNAAPKISFQPSRQKGTSIWPKTEKTPGPGTYDHANSSTFGAYSRNRPAFSMPHGKHINMNYNHDPYATYSK